MARVVITSANTNSIAGGARGLVRASNGDLYALILDETDGGIEIWKSDDDGATWAEQDASNNPQDSLYEAPSCAIDSANIIHITYWDADSMGSNGLRYVIFTTSTDVFSGDIQLAVRKKGTSNAFTSIAIDSNDEPHIVFIDGEATKGTDYDTVWYGNHTSGAWDTAPIEIEGKTNEKQTRFPEIVISDEDVPEVAFVNITDTDITAALGNQNAATSFELKVFSSSTNQGTVSIAVDSVGDTWVAWTSNLGVVLYKRHIDSNIWSTWETAVSLGSATHENPSLALDGTDRYIFVEDSSNSDLYYFKNDESRVLIETGTFNTIKTKWAFLNNNEGSIRIDYIFTDETASPDIFWNEFVISAGASLTQSLADAVAVVITNKLLPVRIETESLILSESISKKADYIRSLVESLSLNEALKLSFSISKSELVNITEVISTSFGKQISVSDSFIFAEQLSILTGKTLSDSIAFTELLLKTFVANLAFSETLSIAETLQKELGLSFTDSLSLAEILITTTGTEQLIVDSVSLSESLIKEFGLSQTDVFAFIESIATTAVTNRIFTDSFSLAEALQKELGLKQTEAFGFVESLTTISGKTLIAAFDLAEAKFEVIGKGILVSLSFGETMKAQVEMSRTEALSFAESLSTDLQQPAVIIYEYILRLS